MKLFLEITFRNLYYFITKKSVRQFNLLVFLYGDAPRYQEKKISINGWKLRIPDALSFIWQFREIMVDQSYYFKCNTEVPIIIDCGSNIGLSALYFNKLYPKAKITCIEADQKIADTLKRNFQNNGIKNIDVINKAVWIHNDGVQFNAEGSDGGSIGNSVNAKLTESIRLKDLLNIYSKIDFLKMDIEGAENSVIPDCAEELKKVDQLFIEYHSSANEKQPLAELLGILTNQGFHYYIKTENKRTSPLVNRHLDKMYDLQLNIFAYRN